VDLLGWICIGGGGMFMGGRDIGVVYLIYIIILL